MLNHATVLTIYISDLNFENVINNLGLQEPLIPCPVTLSRCFFSGDGMCGEAKDVHDCPNEPFWPHPWNRRGNTMEVQSAGKHHYIVSFSRSDFGVAFHLFVGGSITPDRERFLFVCACPSSASMLCVRPVLNTLSPTWNHYFGPFHVVELKSAFLKKKLKNIHPSILVYEGHNKFQ